MGNKENEAGRKKKRRKRILWWPIVLFACIAIASGICSLFLIFSERTETMRAIRGNWYRKVDLTDDSVDAAQEWIKEALMSDSVDVSEFLAELELPVYLTFAEGEWQQEVREDDYLVLEEKSLSGMTESFRSLIETRLERAGIENFDIDGLMEKAVGMDLKTYLSEYGPDLLPEYEELSSDFNAQGSYVVKDELLYRGESGTSEEELLSGSGTPVLVGEQLVISDPNLPESIEVYYKSSGADGKNASGEITKEPLYGAKHAVPKRVSAASLGYPINLQLQVEGKGSAAIRAYEVSYPGNYYLSLRDVANALSGTEKAFDVSMVQDGTLITPGKNYEPKGGENTEFTLDGENDETISVSASSYKILKGENKLSYYTLTADNAENIPDCFMNLIDLSMCMDLCITRDKDLLTVDISRSFSPDPTILENEEHYFAMVDSALVGDATTGEIYYSYREDDSVPIASITKLMTYLLVMDALSVGEISYEDVVVVSEKAAALSTTSDGVVVLTKGQESNIEDLLKAMLLGSSNECALTLAEHVSGTEEAFVDRMNQRAKEIGMSDEVIFYNCNGLPTYSDGALPVKLQNRMTARDMFLMTQYIFSIYPQITEITSLKSAEVETLDKEFKNTNPILSNVEGVVGLKTGTTDRAGACLVAAAEVKQDNAEPHRIVAMEFGAESSVFRSQVTELLIRYGKAVAEGIEPNGLANDEVPTDPETLIRKLIVTAKED